MATSNRPTPFDISMMKAALALARRGLGNVWPNPAVGCVITDVTGQIVGRGWTQPGGRPHAETEALRRAGERARGGTAYVTLEPCSHHGQTPPCANGLIEAGVATVVVALRDPDHRVNGRGIAMLRDAGLTVIEGVMEDEARAVNIGFLNKVRKQRPWVGLKLATTLDGKIALGNGDSQWITGDAARAYGHWLRASFDAILVGAGTAVADDPELTCRLPGLGQRSPVRIVMDSTLRTPLDSKLVMGAPVHPTWIVTSDKKSTESLRPFLDNGVEVVTVPASEAGRPNPRQALNALAEKGITRLLIEGGAEIATAFLKAGLVDEVFWFRAPKAIGSDGRDGLAALELSTLTEAPIFERKSLRTLGEDHLEHLLRVKQN